MIGLRGGINIANQTIENAPSTQITSGRIGGLAGGQFDIVFNDSWTLSAQILFDQKGAHADFKATPINGIYFINSDGGTADWVINYLEIPLLAKFSFGDGPIRPYIFAGPSLGILISNEETLSLDTSFYGSNGLRVQHTDMKGNISDSTAKVDVSILAGAGISFKLSSGPILFLDAGFAFGLVNNNHYSESKGGDEYVYSRDIRIAAGVMFPIR